MVVFAPAWVVLLGWLLKGLRRALWVLLELAGLVLLAALWLLRTAFLGGFSLARSRRREPGGDAGWVRETLRDIRSLRET